jgi:hypothetical protein
MATRDGCEGGRVGGWVGVDGGGGAGRQVGRGLMSSPWPSASDIVLLAPKLPLSETCTPSAPHERPDAPA